MAKLLSAPSKNAVQKELSAQLLNTAGASDPISFDDVDGIPNLPGVLVINRVDSSGVATPAKREYIEYSGTSGNTVLITTRDVDSSNSALTHAIGSIVEFIPDVVWAGRIYSALSTLVDVDDTSVINTNIVLADGTDASGFGFYIDENDMASDSETKLPSQQSVKAYSDSATQTMTNKTLTAPIINGEITGTFGGYNDSLNRQSIINGGFTVNQRGYTTSGTLASGSYGHDRWKAGSGGGDYTFTQLASSTQITIEAGKTLIQVIEDKNVVGGTYTLSWTGTAQARAGVDSATPSGAYADSPLAITSQTAGTVMSVEFDDGTLGEVQLNTGSVVLPFQPKSFAQELLDCQRYYEKSFNYSDSPTNQTHISHQTCGVAYNTTTIRPAEIQFLVRKRSNPTMTIYSDDNISSDSLWAVYTSTWIDSATTSISDPDETGFNVSLAGTFTLRDSYLVAGHWTAESEL